MPRLPAGRKSVAVSIALIGAVAAGTAGVFAVPPAAAEINPTTDKLGDHDRTLIAQYARQRATRALPDGATQPMPEFVTLLLAVRDGQTEQVTAELTELGATVTGTTPEIGYVKVNVPFADIDRAVAIDEVVAADVDELLRLEPVGEHRTAPAGGKPGSSLPTAPSAATPDDNPYLPTGETGSVTFKVQHPTYDGRGVTIGIMDSGVDPTHPALATTTTGELKLVDSVVGSSPANLIDTLFDDTWRYLSPSSRVTGPTFTDPLLRRTWTGPAESGLRVSAKKVSVSSISGSYLGVLYRESDDAVWVDTDQDFDFTDEELMRPFAVARQLGHLGVDDPATPVNERVPFTIDLEKNLFANTSSCRDAGCHGVNINWIAEGHGTHVAGIAAGHGLFGGAMNGQAPGAKLVSMRACHASGCSTAALTDGMVELATVHGVDVINMSIGSSPTFNDGHSARELLYNRLIDETGVQIFISAGNSGAGTNTVGEPTGADRVVSVGASVSKETWWANYGSQVKTPKGIFPFSSRGPREDGGFKPDITAPGSAVSTTPDWTASSGPAETGYALPPGYSMLNGTSMAAPQATGAAALLLSAAKQHGLAVTPADLRNAIYATADFTEGVEAIAQGRGQLDVRQSWTHLTNGVAADTVTVDAPVCTILSHQLTTPHRGSGLYNGCAPSAGGQVVGAARTYDLTLTRTGGADTAVTYALSLQGDDGTFTVPAQVLLDKNVPTTVQVTATPATQGMHSAVLVLDDPATRAVEQHTMLAVRAAAPLAAGATWSVQGTVKRNGTIVYAVAVPAGTKSLTVNLSGLAGGSQTRWWAFNPNGVSGERSVAGTGYCYAGYLDGNGCDPAARTYTNPLAGVWEFVVESRRTSPLLDNPFQLQASITQ
ncbi:serine protease [Catellatospora sp. IY07-71]|uniref:S8 family serine peptidase n=1 Tax=Catellatospora sp. IY07-71 TaxID=2728827 RepID=UPI001BB33148|nr:S8 family serine peptidase [Catellatospora sp. IY07-71]BCJ75186.1 serine protease [Catellatospora sp. IY07-71]